MLEAHFQGSAALRCCAQLPLLAPFPSLTYTSRHPAALQSLPANGPGRPEKGATRPYQNPPPAPAATPLRGPRRAPFPHSLRACAPSLTKLAGPLRCVASRAQPSRTHLRRRAAPGPKKAPRRPSAPPDSVAGRRPKKACHPPVIFAFQPRRQKQGPLRGGFYRGVPRTPATMPRQTPGHPPRPPQPKSCSTLKRPAPPSNSWGQPQTTEKSI